MQKGDIVDAVERGPKEEDTWHKLVLLEEWGRWWYVKKGSEIHAIPTRCLVERSKS